jgi:RNA polymerase primary sigma factor
MQLGKPALFDRDRPKNDRKARPAGNGSSPEDLGARSDFIDSTPLEELCDKSQQIRLGRELRDAALAQVELFRGLASPCRDHVLNGDLAESDPRRLWTFARLEKHYDRLVRYATAHDDEAVSTAVDRARRLRRRMNHARDALILANLGIVHHVVKDFAIGKIPLTDLIQEGYLGLLKAVDRYDPERGYAFSTYASWWIRRALNDAFTYRARLIRLPENVRRDLRHLRLASTELEASLGRVPTESELAARMQATPKRVKKLLAVVKEPHALEDLTGELECGWDSFIGDGDSPDPLESTLRGEMREHTSRALEALSPRERAIVRLRFGFEGDGDHSLTQISRVVGVSRERVRQIEQRALEKIGRWARRAGILSR